MQKLMFVSIIIALVMPFVVLFIIWQLELYAISRMRLLIAALIWGVVAFMTVYGIQTSLLRSGILSIREITLLSSPVLEEFVKLLPLTWLAWRMKLRYAADGMAYGFAIGTGFGVTENMLYITT